MKIGYGGGGFSSELQARTLLRFVLSCSVFFRCGANFLRSWAAELEVAATQILEFADEVFCAAEVPALQRVLSAGSTQSASSALLLRTCLSQTEQSGKSAPLGTKTGQPKLLQRASGEFENWVTDLPLPLIIPFHQGYQHLRYGSISCTDLSFSFLHSAGV